MMEEKKSDNNAEDNAEETKDQAQTAEEYPIAALDDASDEKVIEVDESSIETPLPVDEEEVPSKAEIERDEFSPKTSIGTKVKRREITDIDTLLDESARINESSIIDMLIPEIETELLMVGQSKGKFGGGQRRVFKQTQKKTKEGNKPQFSTFVAVGDSNGHLGLGFGKSRETVPAREKAIRNAKKNIIKVRRGCGSWQCTCGEPHSIPFKVSAKSGSVKIDLIPAPKGTGLLVQPECQKMLKLAGIEDVWSHTRGQTKSTLNLVDACFKAIKKMMEVKISETASEKVGLISGSAKMQTEDAVHKSE